MLTPAPKQTMALEELEHSVALNSRNASTDRRMLGSISGKSDVANHSSRRVSSLLDVGEPLNADV